MAMTVQQSMAKRVCVQVLVVACCCVIGAGSIVQDAALLNKVFLDSAGTISVNEVIKESPESGLNASCFDPASGYSSLRGCITTKCVGTEDLGRLYGVAVDSPLAPSDVQTVTPGLLHVLTQKQCSSDVTKSYKPPATAAVWGYSFLFVTLINLCSLFGALVLPCMDLKIYKRVLMFLIALAVGTLVGSGLLVLIPEALELNHGDDLKFVWKTTTVFGGIYLFFCLERVMRMINDKREMTREMKRQNDGALQGTFHGRPPGNPVGITRNFDRMASRQEALTINGYGKDDVKDDEAQVTGVEVKVKDEGQNGSVADKEYDDRSIVENKRVAPVAYMIIFGDALHNLIDGLSIGAAFTDTTLLGISVSVAVMCEELPHELGDFAILLNSGMSVRKALLFNFLSSLTCYVGLVIGILLGENTSANTWIFAIAGGMFLYISLADMLPEMNSAAETEACKEFGEINTFILQNIGLLVGFGIILVLAVYGGDISFE
ncbi:metal cation symporter ZIP14-like isoform X2 [Littorina saxatilis]|uniref:Zinc transporter ZIP14 n=2 Tax=Littorina saxatilis TaxID=31220 RepID=A0AAN9B309_9CAEN